MPPKLKSWTDWKLALLFTVILRLLFSALAAACSFFLHPDPTLVRSNELTEHLPAPGTLYYALFGIWERFDTLWYLRIAQHGYDRPMSVIFYPLYPLLVRAASFGNVNIASALLISTVAAFFVFWGLLRLAKVDLGEAGRFCMLLLFAAWPTSFVLFAGYAESVTLAFMFWAVNFAREGKWWRATCCGILAGIGRPSGVLVALPLFVLAARSRRWVSLPLVLSPMGLLGYWAWLRWSGHPSVVAAYRSQQGMTLVPPWTGLSQAIQLIVTHGDALLAIKLALLLLMLFFSLRREVRVEDKLFALAIILQMLMYTGRPLLGAARYLLAVYPGFIALAGIAARGWNSRQFSFYFASLAILNLAWMVAFFNWSLVL